MALTLPSRAALFGLLLLGACRRTPPPAAVAPTDTNATALLHLTQMQLHAPSPAPIQVAINCEVSRLGKTLGSDSAQHIAKAVSDYFTATTSPAARERVFASLAGKQFVAEVGCDSVASTGVLGGTWLWPPPGRLPGDSTWRGKY